MEKIKVERSILFQISYFRKSVVKKLRVVVNDGDLANKSNVLSLDDDKIKNVLEFNYLGVIRRNRSGSANTI